MRISFGADYEPGLIERLHLVATVGGSGDM